MILHLYSSRVNVCHWSHWRTFWKCYIILKILGKAIWIISRMLILIFSKSCCLIFEKISLLSWYIFIKILWLRRSKYIYTVFWKICSSLLCLKWSIASFLLKILIIQFKIFINRIFWWDRLILRSLVISHILIILNWFIHKFFIWINFNVCHFYFCRFKKVIKFKKFNLSVSIIFYSSDDCYKLTINSFKSICF